MSFDGFIESHFVQLPVGFPSNCRFVQRPFAYRRYLVKCSLRSLFSYPYHSFSAENQQNSPESLPETNKAETTACIIPKAALPQDLLAGTDVLPLAEFEIVAPTEKRAFRSEMGGAILQINIERDSEKQTAVVRKYVEPGMPAESKRYDGLCINQEKIYGPIVRGIFVQDGLLWLELYSGNDFLSPDLWIFMQGETKNE